MESGKQGIIGKFRHARVLVVGDLMLDKYILGDVRRLSPEAPVPVVSAMAEKKIPGGAANVANNIASLGGKPILVGIAGDDPAGKELISELSSLGISAKGVVVSQNFMTTQKIRVLSGSQQLLRLDYEHISNPVEDELCSIVRQELPGASVIVVSDYAKGVVSGRVMQCILSESKKLGKKVIVDPKPANKKLYKGAYLITPNQNEAEEMAVAAVTDETAIVDLGNKLAQELSSSILITRGAHGMSLFSGGEVSNLPTQAKEVFDVSGAGDTVVAGVALAIASGASLFEAAELANHAAGIVVGKAGTATVTPQELLGAYETESKKLKSLDEMKKIRSDLVGKKVVFTNGCFDILHSGHISLLKQAKGFGDILIVGINSDESVRALKGPKRPILSESERCELLSALESVDYVVVFGDKDPCRIISELKPDVHVKGGDYDPNDFGQMPESKVVKSYGGQVRIVKLIGGKSTTGIIEKVLAGQKTIDL